MVRFLGYKISEKYINWICEGSKFLVIVIKKKIIIDERLTCGAANDDEFMKQPAIPFLEID